MCVAPLPRTLAACVAPALSTRRTTTASTLTLAESVDLRGKGNALAIKDINASVAHLEEQIAEHNSNLPDGTVYEFDIPEGETLTAEQLSDVGSCSSA